jgi:hypothetical protein
MASKTLKTLAQQVDGWPEQDQQELANVARVIEAQRSGLYLIADDEPAALVEGISQADTGDFFSDAKFAAAHKRHRV